MSGRVVFQPAINDPSTAAQVWNTKHLWGLIGMTIVGGLLTIFAFAMSFAGGLHAGKLAGAIVIGAVTLLLAWTCYVLDPKVRQIRFMKKYPWREYEARVTDSVASQYAMATIKEGAHKWVYRIQKNDDDFTRGDRPILVAGNLGDLVVVISLRNGAGTGIASRSGGKR